MQLLGFIPMKPLKYVHYSLSLVLLLLTVISFLLFILISSLVHHTPVQVRPQDHDKICQTKFHDSKEFYRNNIFFPVEKTLYIPGGSQVRGCNYFFSKKNQVFTFPYLTKIKSTTLNLLREESDLLSLCLDYFCTLLIFKLSEKNIYQ